MGPPHTDKGESLGVRQRGPPVLGRPVTFEFQKTTDIARDIQVLKVTHSSLEMQLTCVPPLSGSLPRTF
jgi:hypothetical protein